MNVRHYVKHFGHHISCGVSLHLPSFQLAEWKTQRLTPINRGSSGDHSCEGCEASCCAIAGYRMDVIAGLIVKVWNFGRRLETERNLAVDTIVKKKMLMRYLSSRHRMTTGEGLGYYHENHNKSAIIRTRKVRTTHYFH